MDMLHTFMEFLKQESEKFLLIFRFHFTNTDRKCIILRKVCNIPESRSQDLLNTDMFAFPWAFLGE